MPWTEHEREILRAVAFEAIEFGLAQHRELPVSPLSYPEALRTPAATFVTLRTNEDELLGCVGTLRACRPLVTDVARNAYHAGFADPRFRPITVERLPHLDLHISVLSALEPLAVGCEEDLLAIVRTGIDGLLLEEGHRAATFLPAMWPRLGDARTFIRLLKEKGGWSASYWSQTLSVSRYTVEDV
jgi:AmmeMemoRadiSam system protein A